MGIEGDERKGVVEPGVLTRDFVLLFVASCFFIGSLYLVLPILPLYMKDIAGATTTQVGLLIGALTVSSFLLRPYVGRKADTFGMKPLLIIGAADFIIASLLYIWSKSLLSLPFVLVFQGIGIACYHTTSLAFVGGAAPESRRGQSMAWFQSSFNVGIMFAPFLGEYLMDRFGYTTVFVTASISAAVSLLMILTVREHKVPDVLGEAPIRRGVKDIRGLIVLVSIAVFAGTATLGSLEAFLALFAEAEGIGRFALFFTISAGFLLTLRLLAGSLPDRLGRRLTGTGALVTLAVSMVVLAFVKNFAGLCVAAVLWGAGFAFLSPSLSALLIDHAPADELGSAFGIYTAAFEGGIAFGAIAMGPVVSWLGFRYAFLFIGCVSLIGAVFFASLFPRLAGKGGPPQHG
ncbi:MAG: MFS transporter [Actinobacteria bacterium]|nr:MFS transporter [Actinomycetota bacterium]MCG2818115.1 MFS transporter [Actinomycetes bacterium]MBU4217622.1 MFS transporter [Actinomycetota bacterium]MBU4359679.1 MFS transporter [Actinomycetota bacterium]MBU4393237.1 MFS transporter [Actinomycetota bacterium]